MVRWSYRQNKCHDCNDKNAFPVSFLLTNFISSFHFYGQRPALISGAYSFTFSGGVVNVNGLKLSPRIVLMTDGKPTGTTEVQVSKPA
jgi:hypothetical protein